MGEGDEIDEEDEDEESITLRNGKRTDNIGNSSKRGKQRGSINTANDQQTPTFQRVVSNCIAFLGVIFIVRYALLYDFRIL